MTYARQRYTLHEPHTPPRPSRRGDGYWLAAALLAFVAGVLFGRAWPLAAVRAELPASFALPLPAATAPNPPAIAPRPERGVFYRNCAEARAAGAAPIYAGQPGYRPGLDRDGDGVACEPWP